MRQDISTSNFVTCIFNVIAFLNLRLQVDPPINMYRVFHAG